MEHDVDPTYNEDDGGRYRGFDLDESANEENHKQIPDDTNSIFLEQQRVDKETNVIHVPNVCVETHNEVTSSDVKQLKKTVAEQSEVIQNLRDELRRANDSLKSTNEVVSDNKKRKRENVSEVMNLAMVADSFDKDAKIRELTNEIQLLKSELQKQRNSTTLVADKSHEPRPTRTLPSSPPTSNITTLLQDLRKGVEKTISDMKDSIEASIEVKIANALQSHTGHMSYAAAAADIGNDGNASTAKQGIEFRTIIANTKNEELLSETDKQRREMNIIIHGVKERSKNSEKQMKDLDDTYVDSLFEILGLTIRPRSTTRLGKFDPDGNCRPLKLVMKSIEEKQSVMSRLSNLKTAEEQYRKISVKDDYTPSERELIKYKQKQAQEMNENENTNLWKVRGTPKNGLRIVKVKPAATSQEPSGSQAPSQQST